MNALRQQFDRSNWRSRSKRALDGFSGEWPIHARKLNFAEDVKQAVASFPIGYSDSDKFGADRLQ
jgi:hypothetical protein